MRPPISLERLGWDGVGEVRYRAKKGHESSGSREREVASFDPTEFLARVIMHIPDPRWHLVRYYGWYSNVSRGRRRKADAEQEITLTPLPVTRDEVRNARALRRSWARLIKRVYEVDPLLCPSCDSEMKVIAFITEHDVVDAILRHLRRKEMQEAGASPS